MGGFGKLKYNLLVFVLHNIKKSSLYLFCL